MEKSRKRRLSPLKISIACILILGILFTVLTFSGVTRKVLGKGVANRYIETYYGGQGFELEELYYYDYYDKYYAIYCIGTTHEEHITLEFNHKWIPTKVASDTRRGWVI